MSRWAWSDPVSGRLLTMPVLPVHTDSKVRLDMHRGDWWIRMWRGGQHLGSMVRMREGWELP
jgi:hypothetical protein